MRVKAPRATVTVALVGNPNTGKTSVFNALTGLSQQVANYPGVTVERVSGTLWTRHGPVQVVDLPGTYSLAARSPDELVAVDMLLGQLEGEHGVDAVVAIVDASNLVRNLYLLSQVFELGLPVVVALTMPDMAERNGRPVDAEALSALLGVPVVPVRADRREGIDALVEAIERSLDSQTGPPRESLPELPASLRDAVDALRAEFGDAVRREFGHELTPAEALRAVVDVDGEIPQRLARRLGPAFEARLAELRREIAGERSPAALEASARYAWAERVYDRAIARVAPRDGQTLSDRIDTLLTHRVWGTVVLLAVLGGVFQAIYAGARPLMDLISGATALAASAVTATLPAGPLESLLADGVIGGVGAVIVFLPQILLLFVFVAILEDCGYMARAAFLMDRLLTRVGLSGQSVIPLLSSFACAVPGIMAARGIADRRDRLATILVAPLMSCSARLPVYVLLIGAFVPERSWLGGLVGLQGLVLLAAHLIGVAVAVPVVWLLRLTILSGRVPAFVLELPAYRLPNLRAVLMRAWLQGREFLVRAGTLILAASVVVWALTYFPRPEEIARHYDELRERAVTVSQERALDAAEQAEYLQQSYMGRFGRAIEPVVRPLGWDWRIGMAAVASFPAREVIIAVLGTILGVEDASEDSPDMIRRVQGARRADGTPLFTLPVALSLLVFMALCAQCVSTLAVMRRETGSWRWPAFAFGYMTVLAWIGAALTYQLARGIAG
ncbi:MAG: ferrous iron transport protein B [Acidobacteria bacterium]|nr:MAG: ferrous iron transport protein B [Acidobacteriota bacterium]